MTIGTYLKLGIGIVVALLIATTVSIYKHNKELNHKLDIAKANEKAYYMQFDSLNTKNRLLNFTVEQLNYYNDSILNKMNDLRKELKIKDKELLSLYYLNSQITKIDTILMKDTIFIKSLKLDTIVGDRWYTMKLGLEYPNKIVVNPSFISEKYIITNSKKETIEPPKKYWIQRIFQKKHTIAEINIVEKSPYIKETQNQFIQIIK